MKVESSWYKAVAVDFGDAEIGEIYGNQDNIPGRKLVISASDLKEIKSKPGYKLRFRIKSAAGDTAKAEIDALIMPRDHIGRLMRHNITKIDLSVKVESEHKKYAVKVVAIVNKAENAYKTAIRKEIEDFIRKETAGKSLKDVVLDAMTNKLQNPLHKALNKIYPTKAVEIRMVEISS
ncbi:MAG: hypothetical protein M1573_01940 [Candidatus Parvarchaeota archaeon]|jgi:ribosomal protein S3AE|nr:hypothetical protein [Candidatus Parvarchaeota archaeon]